MDIRTLVVSLGFRTDAKPLEKIEERLEGIHSKLHFLAAAEVVRGLFELAERFGGLGEQLETAAASAGITTDAFQKLAFGASQNAVGQEELSGALSRLSRQLYEAKNGSEQANKAFTDVGITPEQLAGFRNSSDALRTLSDRLSQIDDPIRKQAITMELLGRGSANMVKYLSRGSAAIDDFGRQAESMGAIVSARDVETLAKFEDTMSGLWQIIKVLGAQIGASFAPAIINLVHKFEVLYAANRQLITTSISKWVYSITYAMGFAYGAIESVVKVFIELIKAHPVLTGRLATLALGLGGVSLAVGAVMRVVGFFTGALSNLAGVAKVVHSVAMPALNGALGLVAGSFGLLRGAIGGIIARLAVALAGVFPAFSAWLVGLNASLVASPIGVFIAALGLAALVIQEIWALLHGKSFSETWMGQMLQKIVELPAFLKKAYRFLKGDTTEDPSDASASAAAATSPGAAAEANGPSTIDRLMGAIGGLFGGASPGVAQAQSMAQPQLTTAGALNFSGMDRPAAAGAYTVNAPVTINVGQNLTPDGAGKAVKEGIAAHLDRQSRSAWHRVDTARVY